jgi:hemin uptake protein HemP
MKAEAKLVIDSRITTPINYSTNALFKDRKTLIIEHRGEIYYLRITRNDKLILTK